MDSLPVDCQKSFAEFFAEAKNEIKSFLTAAHPRVASLALRAIHLLYVGKNTSQAASVEFVAMGEQILRAADCKELAEKAVGLFRQARGSRFMDSLPVSFCEAAPNSLICQSKS